VSTRRGSTVLAAAVVTAWSWTNAAAQPALAAARHAAQPRAANAPTLTQRGGQPTRPAPPPAPQREPTVTVQGLADLGYVSLAAADSFEAVYGSSGGLIWGGGVRVAHRRGWFLQVHAARFAASGERVFVHDGDVFPLGIATHLVVLPVDGSVGWRFVSRPGRPPARPATPPGRPRGPRRWVPFVGGGLGAVRVTEEGDHAEAAEDVAESHLAYHVLGGIELPLSGWLGAGVEAGWRWVPDGLAGSGVAQAFDEPDLHHFYVVARLTFGR
jgi:hypothetical protein